MDEIFNFEDAAPVSPDVELTSAFLPTSDEERKQDEDSIFSENTDSPSENQPDGEEEYTDQPLSDTDALLEAVLKQRGIPNLDSIRIINEEGNPEYVSFHDLTQEEKLSLLESPDSQMLSSQELDTINFLRNNKIDFKEYVSKIEEEAYNRGLSDSTEKSFTVDEATDDQLFLTELKYKYPSLTEEELVKELEREHENPELFEKKVGILRQQYKELEEAERQEQIKKREIEENQQRELITHNLISSAQKVDNLFGLSLDDQDKDEVLTYLLDRGADGKSAFTKSLEDPDMLFYLSWCALKGPQAFEMLHQHYNKELEKARSRSTGFGGRTVKAVHSQQNKPKNDRYDEADIFK